MVLGLNESVSTQSMSVTIQALRSARLNWHWFVAAFRRELATALFLGLACGGIVAVIVWLWHSDVRAAVSLVAALRCRLLPRVCSGWACLLLHHLKLDPKIAAGPVTLALADFFALVFYFTSAWIVL
jgi:magnesium transporter